ncbi:MAG: DNA polymerase III subunit delta' C-terminal domain-containing protein [Haloferula sp.]
MAFTVDQAVTLIEGAHERQRLAHAFLISGPRGSGKEELAARIVKSLQSGGGSGNDLFGEPVKEVVPPLDEMAGEWVRILRPQSKSRRIKVEDVRELEKSLHMVAGPDAWKVGIIVDADRMMPQAENAFLKTLEEPPPRTLLLLLSGTPGALLPTVISRCVRMPLVGKPDLTGEGGAELVEALNMAASSGLGTPAVALGLKSVFSLILARQKAEAESAAQEILKEEEKALRHAVEGDWLKRREDALKAVAESEYLSERARLFDVLQAWLADVLRIKTGAGGLDFPDSAESIREVAEMEPLSGLLQRMEAIEDLRVTLETNAQEGLALEVGFLKAFG